MGVVLRPHALRGEIRVAGFTEDAPNIQAGRDVYIEGTRRAVLRARPDRDAWILKLAGLNDRSQVEALRGFLLEAPDADVGRADADSYFVHELVGLRVRTPEGRQLGEIVEVLPGGSADVYVIRGPQGDLLVPAIAEVVQSISLADGEAVITPLRGMLDDSR